MIDVLVIGAGAAGIAAARRLAREPLSVLVAEAGARPGGRAWTRSLDGMRLDLGCGWLHSADRNRWAALAREQDEPIDETPPAWRTQFAGLGFTEAEQREAAEAFAALNRRLRDTPPASDRAADALLPDCPWNPYLEALSGFMNGAELAALSVADYLAYADTDSGVNWRLPGGYGAFVVQQAAALPIRYETRIAEIDRSGPVLRARGSGGTIEARAMIVAVPTAVLANEALRFSPPLPGKTDAAASLPLGLANKALLGMDRPEPFAADTQLLGNPRDAATGAYYLRPFGLPAIEGFFGGVGAQALEAEGEGAALDFAVAQLVALLGSDMRARLRPLAESRWGADPLAGGSYSHALPGQADARALLAAPVEGRLFFAGEACSARDFSTAHGAFESGEAAAEAAIGSLCRPDP